MEIPMSALIGAAGGVIGAAIVLFIRWLLAKRR